MKIISIISQKGGTGKTTLAFNLAVASGVAGKPAAIFDIDSQASCAAWKDKRATEFPAVIALPAVRISHSLESMRQNGAQLVICDTAPHSQNDALVAAQVSDLILIPCRPSLVDLIAISSSIKIAQIAQKPAIAVITQVQSRGLLADETKKALSKEYKIDIAPCIGNRIAFVYSFTSGKGVIEIDPTSKASEEISTLFSFLTNLLEGKNNEQK